MKENKVYVIQHIAGSQAGTPKINIIGAKEYGDFKFLLPEFSQMIFSPGPLIYKLRKGLKNFTKNSKKSKCILITRNYLFNNTCAVCSFLEVVFLYYKMPS